MKTVLFNKKNLIFTVLFLCISIIIVIFVYNDEDLYNKTIAEVKHTKNTDKFEQKSPNMKNEKYYTQTLTCKVLNGKYKGKKVYIKNNYSKSEVKTERYEKGDRVFVFLTEGNGNEISGHVTGLKRDTAVVVVILMFIYAMIIAAGVRGIAFVVSSLINVGLLYVGLDLYAKGTDIMYICYAFIILSVIISLVFISGFGKSTLISIVSVFAVVFITGAIYKTVLAFSEAPDYIMMEYVSSPNDLNKLFFMEILVGCLGAVMDVAVSVSETAFAILKENPNLQVSDFRKSMKELGNDVTGTMINILFYSYFCGTVPMILVQMKNKYKFSYICRFNLPFELTRFLTGSIGIIITIPVTAFIAWFILYRMKTFSGKKVSE
ncbi:MAG: hypothetical protein HDT39_07795 [Lachnospiraceae bacterium]|nr:hypothetical protein [Lachnospiraceae bacterium]